jgi:O-antigen/teichoic acid export membrane protein
VSVKTDVIANFAGRGWTVVLGLIFVPIYIRLLGVEGYGLIGFFMALIAVLGLLDAGMSLTLNRELARSRVETKEGSAADLVRTLELIYWSGSLTVGALVVVLAPWIVEHWLNRDAIGAAEATWAVRGMGLVVAFQLPVSLYQGGLFGLRRQVAANLMLAVTATFRVAGGALVIWWFSLGVSGYFMCQALIASVAAAWFARRLWREVPGVARFNRKQLSAILPFASAVAANALVGVILTQLDKVILSKFLALEQFGYYTMASFVASGLWAVVIPINTALYPRLVQQLERPDDAALYATYRRYCGLIAGAVLPLAAMLATYPRELVLLWTGDAAAAEQTHLIIALLALGTMLNAMTGVAALLQSAAGYPQLVLRTNACLAVLLVPFLVIIVPRLGGVGAALVWLAINCTYVFVTTPLMHRRLLRGRYGTWLLHEFALPVLMVAMVSIMVKLALPAPQTAEGRFGVLCATWLAAVAAVLLVLPVLRASLLEHARALLVRHHSMRRAS